MSRRAVLLATAAAVVAVASLCWSDEQLLAGDALVPAAVTSSAGAAEAAAAAAPEPWFATTSLRPSTEPSTEPRAALESADSIAPLGDLVVTVEAASGQPQNVPLVLTRTTAAIATEVVIERATDEQATARFPRRLCSPRVASDVPCVDLAFPTSGAHALQFDASAERLNLFVPDQGALRIEVVEADGAPIGTTALVELRVLQATPPADRRHFRSLAGGGAGVIAVEAAGLQLEVRVTTGDGRRSPPMIVTGPVTCGAVVPCVVRLAPRALFSARMVRNDGRPLADEAVDVWLADGPSRLAATRTNGDGWLAFPAQPGDRAFPGAVLFLAHTKDGAELHGTLLANLQPSAAGALGAVQLQDCGLICAGICVDAEGRPVPGLELIVQVERPAELRGRGPLLDSAWLDLAMTPVRSAPDGSFRIYGPPQFGRRLQLRARGKPELTAVFVEGTPDLRLAPLRRLRRGFLR